MSTTARKARKRSGVPLTRAPKTGTPWYQRSIFTTIPVKVAGQMVFSETAKAKRLRASLEAQGITEPGVKKKRVRKTKIKEATK